MLEESRPSWDDIWFSMALTIAERSKCDRAQVGCVIVDESQNVLATSYNGTPPEYETNGSCSNWCPRAQGKGDLGSSYSNCPMNHAEINAISRADKSRMKGATAYVTRSSCFGCAKALAAAGIVRLVHRVDKIDFHRNPEEVEEFLRACKVTVERWNI